MRPEVKEKIIQKIYGMAIIRKMNGEKPKISIPEFKFILSGWRIKKKMWFKIAKELERDSMVELRRNCPMIINCIEIRKRDVNRG